MPLYNISKTKRLVENIRAIRTIMPEVLARERELAHSKWFAYRFMSPLAATELFADFYRKGVKAYVREHRDIEEAEKANGIADNIFSQASSSLTQLWQARQKADELSLPYDTLIDFGFHFVSRRRWRSTPRPIQLFGSKNSDVAWPMEIAKYVEDRLPMTLSRIPVLPQYQTENYRGLPVQDRFREHVLEDLKTGNSNWSTKIGNACVGRRHLPLRSALQLVPDTEWSAIATSIRMDLEVGTLVPPPEEHVTGIALAPACIGIPSARDESSSDCQSCSFNASCRSLIDCAAKHLVDRFGTPSPLADARREHERKKRNERQKRFRDRSKIKLLAAEARASDPE
ncbi:hypothetical protein SAZ10_07710 [Mesorhizobium sp. BAC0120]|uniref:hypothetical protein n=1 Tax=Mesorhizobium sp. BAC0120 TaxID=3090670 RepID=UPI00298D067D|nr:hypothetical protein [Mesorhizobium sp. BAC0120]MDW6021650.1 hypothetical protein [Mesorhizobium sp. BAC0120]